MGKNNLIIRYALLLTGSWLLGLSGIVYYTPAMGDVARQLQVSPTLVKLTITYFIVGKAVSMFFSGPIADILERKKYLLFGLCLFTAGSLLAAATSSIDWIIIGRFCQGMGVSLVILMGRAIVNNQFIAHKAARVFSYIFIGNAIVIIALPVLGGYVSTYWGWRWIFLSLAIYGACVSLLIAWLLPSSPPLVNRSHLSLPTMKQNYQTILRNRSFWAFLLCLAFMMAGEKAFTTSATFIYVSYLGMSKIAFGYLKAAIWLAHLIGLLICGTLVRRYGIERLMTIGIWLVFIAAVILGMGIITQHDSARLLAAAMLIYMLGSGFIMATSVVGIVRPFPNLIGLATATAMFIEFALESIISFTVSHLSSKTVLPVSIVIICMGLAGILVKMILGLRTPV